MKKLRQNFFTLVKEKYRFEHSVQFLCGTVIYHKKVSQQSHKKKQWTKTPKDIINQTIIIESKLFVKKERMPI